MVIPLHENLPKEDFEEKAEPVPFAEMKFISKSVDAYPGIRTIERGPSVELELNSSLYESFK